MYSLGSTRRSRSEIVRSISVGDEFILKGNGLVRAVKIISEETNLYLVKNLNSLELIEVSSSQLTKE